MNRLIVSFQTRAITLCLRFNGMSNVNKGLFCDLTSRLFAHDTAILSTSSTTCNDPSKHRP